MSNKALTISLDLEDHLAGSHRPPRYLKPTHEFLDLLEELNAKATFFVVGNLAVEDPELTNTIAARGHEVALHSYQHTPLVEEHPETYGQKLQFAKSKIEDLIGRAVVGFRAPSFSLVWNTEWITDVLINLGFTYSSSVLPAENPLFGYPGAPQDAFKWPNGLIEIPTPLAKVLGITLPYLGGTYLRYLPEKTIFNRLSRTDLIAPWLYCHPYDFDHKEPFFRFPHTALWMSLLLCANRKNTSTKIARLLRATKIAPPFGERVNTEDFANLAVFRAASGPVAGARLG
ncbi:MAG: polysaccharide deacetylase family protein [Pseudomonadota bacterium]